MLPVKRAPGWARWTLLMASLGWLLLTAASYLSLPMFQKIWWFGGLVTGVFWTWAALWSFAAVMAYLSLKAYVRSLAMLVIAVTLGAVVRGIDWQAVYVGSLLRLHREEFAALVEANERGRRLSAPWWMEYLSKDGRIRRQGEVIYLPVFEDSWREESGVGIAHLPVPPTAETFVRTAAGDIGRPVRDLGDGWWWVE
ncbi:hypothetical protein ACWDR1_18725 [Streptosporangium sandarakinum]